MENKKEELKTEACESGVEAKRGRSRRNAENANGKEGKHFHGASVAAAVIILTAGVGCGLYVAHAGTYDNAFLPNTTVNGMDVSGKTTDEVMAMIEAELSGYEITILERTGTGETIKKEEIGLRSVFDGSLETIIDGQEPIKWIKSLWTPAEYEIETMLVYDEAKLAERVRNLSCMDAENMVEPQNAYLTDYQSGTMSYGIVEAVQGTELLEANVCKAIGNAVMVLAGEVDLDAADCYTKPAVYADDETLVSLAAELNRYVGAVVNHTFGDAKEVLNGEEIHTWLTVDGSQVILDESGASRYVRALAKKYNTAYNSKKLKTSYGTTVTVPAGPYGWRMNETKEAAAVLEAVKAGNQVTREPEWLQKGASHGDFDYGDTYVEINLTAQHLFFYKDGKLIVESDFVSGNASRGWSTPAGAYPLTYKQRDATLRGEDYETPVSYWMPFNGNIGLHDASWRSSFGGALYKTGGSHGCVNLPPKAAKLIYENISAGDPILCYELAGTESKTTSKASDVNTSGQVAVGTAAETTTAAGTTAATTAPTTAPTTAAPTTAAATPAETTTAPVETTTAVVPETTAPQTTQPAGPSVQPETAGSNQGPSAETTVGTAGPGGSSTGNQTYGPGSTASGPGGETSSSGNIADGPGAQNSGTSADYSAGPGAQ